MNIEENQQNINNNQYENCEHIYGMQKKINEIICWTPNSNIRKGVFEKTTCCRHAHGAQIDHWLPSAQNMQNTYRDITAPEPSPTTKLFSTVPPPPPLLLSSSRSCSNQWTYNENQWKSKGMKDKSIENHWKFNKINAKLMKIISNQWNFKKINENQ